VLRHFACYWRTDASSNGYNLHDAPTSAPSLLLRSANLRLTNGCIDRCCDECPVTQSQVTSEPTGCSDEWYVTRSCYYHCRRCLQRAGTDRLRSSAPSLTPATSEPTFGQKDVCPNERTDKGSHQCSDQCSIAPATSALNFSPRNGQALHD
jgi:hypothetical protein